MRDGAPAHAQCEGENDATRNAFALDASRVTLAAVAKALPAKAALIEFIARPRGQPTTAIVVTQHGEFAVPVAPIDSMRDDIDRFLAVVQSERSDSAAAARLGEQITRESAAPAAG